MILPLGKPTLIFKASYTCTKVLGSGPLQSNRFNIEFHNIWAHLQLRNKWSIDSTVSEHTGEAYAEGYLWLEYLLAEPANQKQGP